KARRAANVRAGHERDVPPGPAVAAVRAALRDVPLTPEAERPVAAPPGLHVDAGPVLEHVASVRDGDEAPPSAGAERDGAVALGEDGVVAADPRAGAGPEACAALAHDDRSRGNALAVEDLDAEHFRLRVAPAA